MKEVNKDYQDLVVFKEISLKAIESNGVIDLGVFSKTTLTENEEQELKEKMDQSSGKKMEKDDFYIYFPAFYSTGKTLKENNESILREPAHKITYDFEVDECKFRLDGYETNACIEVSSSSDSAHIPEELSRFKLPFKIGWFIKTLTLNGDEEIDFSNADDLRLLDAEDSDRYRWGEDGKLYEDRGNNNMVEVNIPGECVRAKGTKELTYKQMNNLLENMEKGYDLNKDVPIEKFCVGYKFKINSEIRTFTLSGNIKYDFSDAKNLRLLDVGNSKRYFWKDGNLYESQDGDKDAVKVEIPEKCVRAKGIKQLDFWKMHCLLTNLEYGYNFYEDVPIEKFCLDNK